MCFNIDFDGNLQHISCIMKFSVILFPGKCLFHGMYRYNSLTFFLVKTIYLLLSTEHSEFFHCQPMAMTCSLYTSPCQEANTHPHGFLSCLCLRFVCVPCTSAETKMLDFKWKPFNVNFS